MGFMVDPLTELFKTMRNVNVDDVMDSRIQFYCDSLFSPFGQSFPLEIISDTTISGI
jgi:hypothetical protein